MSKGRVEDVLGALRAAGWLASTESDDEQDNCSLLALWDEILRLTLRREGDRRQVELEFHAFGDLGERTSSLQDILYCVNVATGRKLYFKRRDDPQWRTNVDEFVSNLES